MKGSRTILGFVIVSFVLYIIFIEAIPYKNSTIKLRGKNIGRKDTRTNIGFIPKRRALLPNSFRP